MPDKEECFRDMGEPLRKSYSIDYQGTNHHGFTANPSLTVRPTIPRAGILKEAQAPEA